MTHQSISHLPLSEQQHFERCPNCHLYFDRRDLGEVIYHDQAGCVNGSEMRDVKYSSSRKVGIPKQYGKDGSTIDLN